MSMEKQWIGIEEAAEKYQVSFKCINDWCEKQEIISSKVDCCTMIHEDSLRKALEWNKRMSLCEYEFKCKMNKIMEENEEQLYVLKSLKELTPFIRLMIEELAGLIKNEKRRRLFLYVVTKGSTKEYANENIIDGCTVRWEFESILREIKSHAGFLKTYKEDTVRLKSILRLYEKKYGNELLGEGVKTIGELEKAASEEKQKAIELLQTPLRNFNWSPRVEHVFSRYNIITLHDLLQITLTYGIGRLSKFSQMGPMTLRQVIEKLRTLNILDDENNSYLYKYL